MKDALTVFLAVAFVFVMAAVVCEFSGGDACSRACLLVSIFRSER